MITELMPASAHDPFARGCDCAEPDACEPHPASLPLHPGMSAPEIVRALVESLARREIDATRLW